jgi:putative endonuclease
VLATNVRSPWGEVDLVLADKGVMAFAEVKTRGRTDLGRPRDFVSLKKQRAIASTALHWLGQARVDPARVACRFDVFEVDARTSAVEWLKGAFDAPDDA